MNYEHNSGMKGTPLDFVKTEESADETITDNHKVDVKNNNEEKVVKPNIIQGQGNDRVDTGKNGCVSTPTTRSLKEIPLSYVEAIQQLNTLQSNTKAMNESKHDINNPVRAKQKQVDQVLHYLGLVGVTLDDIKKLNVIHISGTKGKGSTCAYCESILRSHGFSTGFFSSPHLIEVRERIKLNGQPISYEKFTSYFWTVYNALYANRSHPDDMPAYFKFLTVMSFYVFVKEKPDVCIVEVGIGGLYDNTNIVPNTAVVGITSLGYDHTQVLGNTIEQIAVQKAGIMKPDCIAITSGLHSVDTTRCKQILLNTSNTINCVLLEAPASLFNYNWKQQPLEQDWNNTIKSVNISLAIQLAFLWMFKMNKSGTLSGQVNQMIDKLLATQHRHSLPLGPGFEIDSKTYRGIKQCVWPGRVQVVYKNKLKYFLDGAHTIDSLEICSHWFQNKSQAEAGFEPHSIQRILVFNVTGERDPAILLPPLLKRNQFDYILITPNVLTNQMSPDTQYGGNLVRSTAQSKKTDVRTEHVISNNNASQSNDISKGSLDFSNSIQPVQSIPKCLNSADSHTPSSSQHDKVIKLAAIARSLCSPESNVLTFTNVMDTYNFRHQLDPSKEYHILVTGSLHLVGAFLNVLSNYD
uniref:tetrahydrofolate synthase n=1 Tax=Cacopsylla melanoneura TaxID=428564 RepID=A0A8D8TKL0_9HEMI